MSHQWPALGPAHLVDGFIEPMQWGTSTYTVIRVPDAVVDAARTLGTRRVAGELEGVPVNLALTRAPVFAGTFVWAGASLLRRMRLEVGDPVTGHLAPVDPDEVPVPPDLADSLEVAGLRPAWDALPPTARRRRLVPVDAAGTPATRARRIQAIVDGLQFGRRSTYGSDNRAVRVLIVANDTRGGVEPYAHLARGLRSAGHSVSVAAPSDYASMFRGVEAFVALVGAGRAEIEATATEKLSLRAMGALVSDRARTWTRQTREIADDIDLLCAGIGGAMIAQPVAQAVRAPFVRTHLQPIDAPSSHYPGLLTPWLAPLGSLGNRLGHAASRAIMQTALGPPMRAARAELGLPRRQDPPHPTILYGFSPHVVPVKSDNRTRRIAAGYWTSTPEDEYADRALEDFLNRPGPVVSIGFGSMRAADPEALRAVVLEAVQRADVRAVLLSGWGAIADAATRDDLFTVESVPHSWLFPRVAATVHHGGAGTTGAALMSGVPSIVVPFGAEQPFWGARTHQLGVSPPPIPMRHLTATRLATAIRTAIDTPSMQSRASELASGIGEEDGVSTAVRELELIGG